MEDHETISSTSSDTLNGLSDEFNTPLSSPASDLLPRGHVLQTLRHLWSDILGEGVDDIRDQDSFFDIGGTHESAAELVYQTRKLGYHLSVETIFNYPVLDDMATHVTFSSPRTENPHSTPSSSRESNLYTSNVQKYWLARPTLGHCGVALRLLVDVPQDTLQAAFDSLVEMHPMLRCTDGSYGLRFHQSRTPDLSEGDNTINSINDCVDVLQGPVFSVDVYPAFVGPSIIYMASHAAVLDERSWHVIHRYLDYFFTHRVGMNSPGATFRDWVESHPKQGEAQDRVLRSDQEMFWGLSRELMEVTKIHREVRWAGVLAAPSNSGLNIYHQIAASLVCSFHAIFNASPLVAVQHDGRASTENPLDWEDVVGQFSVQSSLCQASSLDLEMCREDIANLVASKEQLALYQPVQASLPEIFFTYGSMDSQPQAGFNFLEEIPLMSKASKHPPRGIFEISVDVSPTGLSYCLSFPKDIMHQEQVAIWADEAQNILIASLTTPTPARSIETHIPPSTDIQYPSVPNALDPTNIEDIYLCSHFQSYVLHHQKTDLSVFWARYTMHITPTPGDTINPERLQSAWQSVVNRHSILRTVFLSETNQPPTLQAVLRNVKADVLITTSDHKHPPRIDFKNHPPHSLLLRPLFSGKIECTLQISHALIDGCTISLLQKDLAQFYSHPNPHPPPAPPFRTYITAHITTPLPSQLTFWTQKLHPLTPCLLTPSTKPPPIPPNQAPLATHPLPPTKTPLFTPFTHTHGITLPTIIDAAWALTLSEITSRTPVFGHIVSGRQIPIPGIMEIAGPMLGVVVSCCEVDYVGGDREGEGEVDLLGLCGGLLEERLEGEGFLGCTPVDFGGGLYNSVVNVVTEGRVEGEGGDGVQVRVVDVEDPWDIDVFLRVVVDGETVRSRLEYRVQAFEAVYMDFVGRCFWSKLRLFMQ